MRFGGFGWRLGMFWCRAGFVPVLSGSVFLSFPHLFLSFPLLSDSAGIIDWLCSFVPFVLHSLFVGLSCLSVLVNLNAYGS